MSDEGKSRPLPSSLPVAAIAKASAAELTATFRRTARRAAVAGTVISAAAAGLLVLLSPWQGTSGSGLAGLPVAVIILTSILCGRMYRAARGAAKIIDGPARTLFATTDYVPRVRYVAHLHRTPDGPTIAVLGIAYTRPAAWFPLSGAEATVYGSLEPGAPAVAVTASCLYIGRIRRRQSRRRRRPTLAG